MHVAEAAHDARCAEVFYQTSWHMGRGYLPVPRVTDVSGPSHLATARCEAPDLTRY